MAGKFTKVLLILAGTAAGASIYLAGRKEGIEIGREEGKGQGEQKMLRLAMAMQGSNDTTDFSKLASAPEELEKM